jgi:DNA-binding MarR family transcriptional regulator
MTFSRLATLIARRHPAKTGEIARGGLDRPDGVAGTGMKKHTDVTQGVALALLRGFYWIELGIRSYLAAEGNPDFTRSEGMVIANIMLGFNRPSDIARQFGVSRQAIHRTIQQMKKKGIVDLIDDPEDGRVKLVVLTNLANKMNEDGIVAMGIIWSELNKRLGKTNLKKAAEVLRADWGPPISFDPNPSQRVMATEEGVTAFQVRSRGKTVLPAKRKRVGI